MVGWVVQHHNVGVTKHHARNHAAHLLAPRKHARLFVDLLAREEHLAKVSAEESLAGICRELSKPIDQVVLVLEELVVFQRQVGCGDGYAPIEGARILGLNTVNDIKKSSHGKRVARQEYDLFVLFYGKANILKQHGSIIGNLVKIPNLKNAVPGLAFGSKDDTRVATCRRLNLLHVKLFEHFLTAGGLLTLRYVGAKALNKLKELLLTLVGLLILLGLLTECQLAAMIPEAIVTGE